MAKILLYDIEATNLAANFGFMICFGWMWYGEKKAHVVSVMDFPDSFKKRRTDDNLVTQKAMNLIAQADMCVYHYGSRFDRQYIQSKALLHNLGPLAPAAFMDTWRVARDNLKLNSNRLQAIADFLGLPSKTPLSGPIWIDATAGDPKAIKYVVDHCRQDVVVLEKTYEKLRGLATQHPNLALVNGKPEKCPNCGEGNLVRQGTRVMRASIRQRYQCQNQTCGAWCTGPAIVTVGKGGMR